MSFFKRFVICLTFAAMLVFSSGLVRGQQPSGEMGERPPRAEADFLKGSTGPIRPPRRHRSLAIIVDLSNEQRSSIRELRRQWKKKAIDFQSEIRKIEIDLQGLLDNQDPNMSRARQRLQELYSSRSEMHYQWLQHRSKVKDVLTEEQRAELPPGFLFGFGAFRRQNLGTMRHSLPMFGPGGSPGSGPPGKMREGGKRHMK